MEKDRISIGQLMGLVVGGLVAPLTQWVTQSTVAVSGSGAWLSGVVAIAPLLLLMWVVGQLFGGGDMGLGQCYERVLGRWLGKAFTLVTLGWCLAQMVVGVRQYGDRLLLVGYPSDGLNIYLLVMLGLVLWITWGKLGAFARAGDIFYLILLLFLVAMLALTLYNIDVSYVLPVWVEDVPTVVQSTVPLLGAVTVGALATAVADRVRCKPEDKKRLVRSAVVLCLLATGIQLAVIGQFGATLAREIEDLFFQMVAGIGVNGAFQRLEALVGGLWVLSDAIFLGLLGWICRGLAKSLFGLDEKRERQVAVGLVTAAFGVSILFVTDNRAVAELAKGVISCGNLAFAFGVLPLLLLISKGKERSATPEKRKVVKK